MATWSMRVCGIGRCRWILFGIVGIIEIRNAYLVDGLDYKLQSFSYNSHEV